MDQKRKDTVIREILLWKESKVLPEQYCDYLLTLYSEGEEINEKPARKSAPKRASLHMKWGMLFALAPIASIVLYFTELSVSLQTALLSMFVILLFIGSKKTAHLPIMRAVAGFMAALIILLLSVEWWNAMSDSFPLLVIILAIQCMVWFLGGMIKKAHYFTIAGALGLILLFGAFVTTIL